VRTDKNRTKRKTPRPSIRNLYLKGSGKIKMNLYYTYNGKYSLLSKDVELSPEWKEVSFKLDEGLEYGYALQGGNIIRAGCGGIYDPFVG
jgi:hypothetical protein